jgi:hypothetical protein
MYALRQTVLFKLKKDADPQKVVELCDLAMAMQGQIPGLIELKMGHGLPQTADKAKGFHLGLVAKMADASVLPVSRASTLR